MEPHTDQLQVPAQQPQLPQGAAAHHLQLQVAAQQVLMQAAALQMLLLPAPPQPLLVARQTQLLLAAMALLGWAVQLLLLVAAAAQRQQPVLERLQQMKVQLDMQKPLAHRTAQQQLGQVASLQAVLHYGRVLRVISMPSWWVVRGKRCHHHRC